MYQLHVSTESAKTSLGKPSVCCLSSCLWTEQPSNLHFFIYTCVLKHMIVQLNWGISCECCFILYLYQTWPIHSREEDAPLRHFSLMLLQHCDIRPLYMIFPHCSIDTCGTPKVSWQFSARKKTQFLDDPSSRFYEGKWISVTIKERGYVIPKKLQ